MAQNETLADAILCNHTKAEIFILSPIIRNNQQHLFADQKAKPNFKTNKKVKINKYGSMHAGLKTPRI